MESSTTAHIEPSAFRGLHRLLPALTLLIGLLSPIACAASTVAEVALAARTLSAEIERARQEMGRPRAPAPSMEVSGALPREAYYIALHLFRTSDQFAFEQSRERLSQPALVDTSIEPGDVMDLVQASISRLRYANKHLGAGPANLVPPEAPNPAAGQNGARPESTAGDFSAVLQSLISANRQLNGLLERPVSSADVFVQVTRAVSYTSRVLLHLRERRAIPSAPPFVSGKEPLDVRLRLFESFKKLRSVAAAEGVAMLDITPRPGAESAISNHPDCAFEIATLLVAELEHLNDLIGGGAPPVLSPDPGRKFPSHVFQRAGILTAQLDTLELLTDSRPGWLGGTHRSAN